MVLFRRGSLIQESLPQALNATGVFRAALQEKETWTLDLSPGASAVAAEKARSGLMLLSGVTNAVLREGELEVTGFVPRVSTDMILKLLGASGCPAAVRVETVALQVEGASGEGLQQALERLSRTPGVFQVAQEGATLRLVRETGRAGLSRLNRALDGTGCFLKAI